MSPEQVVRLCNELLARTAAGVARWEAAEGSVHHFYTDVNSYGYSIASRDRDDVNPYELKVWDDTGRQALMEASSAWDEIQGDSLSAIGRLYKAAKDNALNAGSLFDSVLDDLTAAPEPPIYGDEEPF